MNVFVQPMRALACSLFLSVAVALATAAGVSAQGPAYAAQPPTHGALFRDGPTGRYLLGGTWLYRADLTNVGLAQGWWRGAAATDGWTPVTVPNSYNVGDYSRTSANGYVGWYRKDFTLPRGAFARYVPASGRQWIIRFESVNYHATVWLNGRLLGSHDVLGFPFEFDMKGLHSGVNRLIVRVDDARTPADFPPGPGLGWWGYGGILQEVYLRAVQNADLSQVQIRPLLPCPTCAATISEQVNVRNVTGKPQRVRLRGLYGGARLDFGSATIAPHATWTAQASVRIAHPRLWSIDHPALYRATLTLSGKHGPLAGYVDDSGIRSITVSRAGRLMLNGRLLDLRGVEVHQASITTGEAIDPTQIARLVGWVKELGATVIRTEQPNPQLAELADRDGLLIWTELPINQSVKNLYLGQPAWVAQAYGLLADNILTYQNDPSIMLWSIGNELPTPATGAERSYVAGASALAHKLDPTRPVAMSVTDWPGAGCQAAYAPLDVIGFNDYFGWFDVADGATADRAQLGPFLDTFRACYPNKALFVSEFGFDGNRDGPVEERGTYQFQSDAAAYHLGVFATKPWLSGAMYFLLQDSATFIGYGGGNPFPVSPLDQKGLIDVFGNLKPAFSTVASIFKATTQIAPRR